MSETVTSLSAEEEKILAKMQQINRNLELDTRSIKNLPHHHSRQSSITSLVSSNSVSSFLLVDEERTVLTEKPEKNAHPANSVQANEDQNWEVWGQIVNNWEQYTKKRNYLRELVRPGIPCHFRPLVWQMMSNALDSPYKIQYAEYLKKTSPCEKAIRRDIARTYPKHDMFKDKDGIGQESLFNVMKAYSIHDREVGYCQGSGFIVGLLLMQMPEEEAFSVLVHLMQDYRLRELFKPSMDELSLCMYQLESLLQDNVPALFVHFQSQGFNTTLYASSWFLTIFTTTFSINFSNRIMDQFIADNSILRTSHLLKYPTPTHLPRMYWLYYEYCVDNLTLEDMFVPEKGMEIIFKVAIAYLLIIADHLVNLDMEAMLQYMQREAQAKIEQEPDFLFNVAFNVKINPKKMKRLEKEYAALKAKEHDDQIELRRLRTENGLLLQRIERLEKDNDLLSERLVQCQNARADENESENQLRRELTSYREQLDELTRRLADSDTIICQMKHDHARNSSSGQAMDLIQQLQSQLVTIRLREAETNATARELLEKCRLAEEKSMTLSKRPTDELTRVQEELAAVKVQLAEATMGLREVRRSSITSEHAWKQHLTHCGSNLASSNQRSVSQFSQEMITLKLREATLLADLKEGRHRILDLETQQDICSQQIARRDDEFITMKEEVQTGLEREKRLRAQLTQSERRSAEIEAKRKEDWMLHRIRETELSSHSAELEQKVASLESEKEALLAHHDIHENTLIGYEHEASSKRRTSLQSSSNHDASSLAGIWKDIPASIMTESVGPLDDLCFLPDDPLITSIYLEQNNHSRAGSNDETPPSGVANVEVSAGITNDVTPAAPRTPSSCQIVVTSSSDNEHSF